MPAKNIVLPPNLCQEKKYAGQSVYKKDFCFRHRHGRRGKETLHSYTSLTNNQKNIGDSDSFSMQLSDHYKTKSHMQDTPEPVQSKVKQTNPIVTVHENDLAGQDSVERFLKQAPESLKKIEEAWNREVGTGKRERGNLDGLAGKKMELLPRKSNANMLDAKKSRVLPGLTEWLSTANEHEKRVVHSFITSLSEANQHSKPSRPHSSPAGQLYLSRNQLIKPKAGSRASQRHSRASLSPSIAELTTSLVAKPPTPSSSGGEVEPNTPKTPPRIESSCGEVLQAEEEKVDNQNVEQELVGEKMEKCGTSIVSETSRPGSTHPNEVVKERSRPRSVPIQRPHSTPASLNHNCNNCEPCQKKRMKKLIDEMSGANAASYSELVEERNQNQQKTMCTKIYKPSDFVRHVTEDDYFHHGGAFQNVKPRNKGYFTIHPQFVSENIVELQKLRMRDQKYFGESRYPLF